MADFLLELLSEEIPARMQEKAQADLVRLFAEEIASAGLKAEAVETFATPRRLALIARGLPVETAAVSEEIKGPRANAPEQALEGFLRKTGLAREALVERDGVLFAVVEKAGRATADVIAEAVPVIIRAFPWPKSMRWGESSSSTESLRWVRPLQGIVALFDGKVVPFEVAGVASGAETVGHRFHAPGRIAVSSADDYADRLRAAHVIVDPAERRRIVADGARKAAADAGLTLIEDDGLVAENAGLTEWPVPLLGSFDPSFLDVPREVIQLTMRTNQKYFACANAEGKLAPAFVCTANIEAADGGKAIVEGNRKVLAARLSDAKFFWEQDLKTPLDDYLPKLENMLFYEGMGTLRAKAERISELAAWIAKEYFPERDPETARRAGLLAKADLATGMVGEFPELQGIMGGYYAERAGEKPGTVSALQQQYIAAVEGCIPACVALADRIDTLAAFFARGIRPTGSKDPFALRRAALQTIQTILVNGTRMHLVPTIRESVFKLIMQSLGHLPEVNDQLYLNGNLVEIQQIGALGKEGVWFLQVTHEGGTIEIKMTEEQANKTERDFDLFRSLGVVEYELLDFFADRLKVQQREAGVRHDLIDAVFALGGEDDLVRLLARVKALQAFVTTEDGANLLAGYKRAANILKKENYVPGEMADIGIYEAEPAEADLRVALDVAEPQAEAAVAAEDFEGAMAALASLRAPIDAFFDTVTVNDANKDKREARLATLGRVRDAVHRVADFSRIEG